MTFDEVCREFLADIKVTALSQYVPGLDYDDIVQEMTVCLWKAHQTFVPGTTSFGSYWWSIWINRRRDLTQEAHRVKRPRHILMDDWTVAMFQAPHVDAGWPQAPTNDPVEKRVWYLLAAGETARSVMDLLNLSRRRYYQIIHRWRTEKVKGGLTG